MNIKKTLAFLSLFIPQSLLSTPYIVARAELLSDDPAACDHAWDVVATIGSTVELQVQCHKCAMYSEVPDPTAEEWEAAYGAMDNPYPWDDTSRIRHYHVEGTPH